MSIDVKRPNIDLRRDEIQSLAARGDCRQACKRLMDFIRDCHEKGEHLNEVILLSGRIEKSREDARRLGSSDETRRLDNELMNSLLELLDKAHNELPMPQSSQAAVSKPVAFARGPLPTNGDAPPGPSIDEARARFMARRREQPDHVSAAYVCKDICRSYRGGLHFKLSNIQLELYPGEITGLVGLNGSGKTTFLRIIAGELLPSAGHFVYPRLQPGATHTSQLDWTVIRSQIAHVRQRPHRWFGRAIDNLYCEAALHGLRGNHAIDEVEFYLWRLGLEKYRDASWNQLSGGFAMRFELAKAMVSRPKLLILDEPLAPLDIDAQFALLQDLRDLANSTRYPLSIVISSQHLYEIELVADRILYLADGVPAFYGPTSDIGADRTENAFEFGSSASWNEVESTLKSLANKCVQTALRTYVIHTPVQIAGSMVLACLLQNGIAIHYFRDLSRSTRTFSASIRSKP